MHPRIKKMINVMKEKAPSRRRRKGEAWYLYILQCCDGSFYTGITKDIERRVLMHNEGKASRYTRTRRPVELLYQEDCPNRTHALVRECRVKSFPRKKKEELVTRNKK